MSDKSWPHQQAAAEPAEAANAALPLDIDYASIERRIMALWAQQEADPDYEPSMIFEDKVEMRKQAMSRRPIPEPMSGIQIGKDLRPFRNVLADPSKRS